MPVFSKEGLGLFPKTRVLRVITRLNIGGPSRQALTLTKELRPEFETLLVAGRPTEDEGEMTDPEVPVTNVPLIRQLRPGTDIQAVRRLRRLLIEWKPQIVHTHQAKAGATTRLAASTMRRTFSTVHTFHGHVLDGYFGAGTRSVFLAVEKLLARRTDVLIAVSEEIRDELLDLGIGSEGQWQVIPLGFDLTPFLEIRQTDARLRRQLGLSPEDPLIGVVGRLSPIKDHATLFQAMVLLKDVHLAVFGDGELRQELHREVAQLGLVDRVHFMGWWTDVPAAMAGVDAVVLTSRNEGTPVSLIEALASGRPVVATGVGGVRSVVEDAVSGWVVPSGSPAAVATAVEMLLTDRRKAAVMGEAGRSFVAARFTQDRLIKDIRNLYSSLLGAQKS